MYVSIYVCVSVCLSVYTYLGMYVCMCAYIHVHKLNCVQHSGTLSMPNTSCELNNLSLFLFPHNEKTHPCPSVKKLWIILLPFSQPVGKTAGWFSGLVVSIVVVIIIVVFLIHALRRFTQFEVVLVLSTFFFVLVLDLCAVLVLDLNFDLGVNRGAGALLILGVARLVKVKVLRSFAGSLESVNRNLRGVSGRERKGKQKGNIRETTY